MDGSGLVCQDGTGLDYDNNLTFIVHNLLGNSTSEVLLNAPTYSNSIFDPKIHLFVDKNSQAFKIFLLNGHCLKPSFDDLLNLMANFIKLAICNMPKVQTSHSKPLKNHLQRL